MVQKKSPAMPLEKTSFASRNPKSYKHIVFESILELILVQKNLLVNSAIVSLLKSNHRLYLPVKALACFISGIASAMGVDDDDVDDELVSDADCLTPQHSWHL